MRRSRRWLCVLLGFAFPHGTPAARAGLYYSGEQVAPLPSQWRGFLVDQRQLRNAAVRPAKARAAGRLAAAERKKLRAEAVADLQRLALWLPADGRLLWLLAELAAAHGDVRTAAAIMDGCVTEFGLRAPELRRHRRAMREAADRA